MFGTLGLRVVAIDGDGVYEALQLAEFVFVGAVVGFAKAAEKLEKSGEQKFGVIHEVGGVLGGEGEFGDLGESCGFVGVLVKGREGVDEPVDEEHQKPLVVVGSGLENVETFVGCLL